MRPFFICSLLAACTDYDLNQKAEAPVPADTGDTGTPVPDTGDTGATEPDPDTGTRADTGDEEIASEPVYINTSSTLYSFDPSTGIATRIGDFRDGSGGIPGGMTDIAISLDGVMYGGSFEALYRINPTTAACTFVASLADSMTGLTFVSDGRLVGAGAGVSFVDTTTGRLTPLVPEGEYYTSGDIIGLPDGMLYWTVTGGDVLVQVDPSDGATRRQGAVRVDGIYGLGYASGTLYGFTSSGALITMDDANGRALSEEPLPGEWWGATTNPVLW